MVNRIIKDHLQNNKRVTIPDFGAFIRKDEGTVVFVPFLKKDDGILVERLAAGYGLTNTEAKAVIDEYVLETRKAVENNGFFVIENIGRLKKDGNGVYYLDYNTSEKAGTAGGASPVKQPQPQPAGQPAHTVKQEQTVREEVKHAVAKPAAPQVSHAHQAEQSRQHPAQTNGDRQVRPFSAEAQPQQQRPPYPPQSRDQGRGIPQQRREGISGQPQRRPNPQAGRRPVQKKKSRNEMVLTIAIIAALLAIAVILFAVITGNQGRRVELDLGPAIEQASPAANPESSPTTTQATAPAPAGQN